MESKYFEQLLKMNEKIDKNYLSEKEDMNGIKIMLGGLTETVAKGFENSIAKDDEIIEHQKVTNGRVTILETETKKSRWLYRNPVYFAIIFILAVGLGGVVYSKISDKSAIKKTIDSVAEIIVKKTLE